MVLSIVPKHPARQSAGAVAFPWALRHIIPFEYEIQRSGAAARTLGLADCSHPAPYPCRELFEGLTHDEHTWWVQARTSAGWGASRTASLEVTDNTTTTPFTAEWRNVPTTHNHPDNFSATLWFSENIPLSYRTLREPRGHDNRGSSSAHPPGALRP